MRQKYFLLILCLFIFSAVNAQHFHLGIKGGANINKLTGKSFKEEFSFGYHLGGFAEIGLSDKWSFQPEVLFSEVTADTSSKFRTIYEPNINRLSKIKLGYLSLPLLLGYDFSKKVTLQVGPQFGILINQNEGILTNGNDAFKKGDFSVLAGLKLNLGSFKLYGRYIIGLNDLNDLPGNKDQWKNQSIQLGIGLSIL